MDTTSWRGHSAAPEGFNAGDRVGPYVILEHLGRGGMGQVYLGIDPRLQRKVALKSVLPRGDRPGGPEQRSRILHEARAAARISHPNIAGVHDVIEHESHDIIVMEYVEGESLAERLKRARFTAPDVAAIGRQLASALAAAHAKGIVHRDLKPGNIQIALDGTVKVLDFGLASASAATLASSGAQTTDTDMLCAGTPGYMAPEQMAGHPVDERADIFSLGVVLFEMATGQRPFPSRDPVDLFASMRFPARRADAIDPQVPRLLADVIARAVETEPRARFESAAHLAAALEAVEHELATSPTRYVAVPTRRRDPFVWLSSLVVAACLAPFLFALLGFLITAAFNLTMQRTGRFGVETFGTYVDLGARSNVVLVLFAIAMITIMHGTRFVLRVLTLVPAFDGVVRRVTAFRSAVADRLSLNDPIVLAQALAAFGAVLMFAVIWTSRGLLAAVASDATVAPQESLGLLAPENDTARAMFKLPVYALLFIVGSGLVRILQLRARSRAHGGTGAMAAVISLFVLLLMLHELPYRILFRNQAERLDAAGERCYLLGSAGDEWLVYCPDAPPPRNRVLKQNDPAVRRTGVVESIFTPAPKGTR
jgi:hypothetical protein